MAAFLSLLMVIGLVPMAVFAFMPQEGQTAYSFEGDEYKGADGLPYALGPRHYILYDSQGNVRVDYSDGVDAYKKYMVRDADGGERQVYCIESGVPFGADGSSYTSQNSTNSNYFQMLPYSAQYGIMLTSVYGWQPGKQVPVQGCNEDDYMIATQALMWEYQQQIRTSPTDLHANAYGVEADAILQMVSGRPARKCYDWMLAQMARHTTIPSFAAARRNQAVTHTLKYDAGLKKYVLMLEDTNHTLSDLKFDDGNGITVSREGSRYTFSSDRVIENPVMLTAQKDIPEISNNMLIWGCGGAQTMMCGAEDPVTFYVKINTETNGTGHIKKISEDNQIESVRFQISGNGEDRIVTTGQDGTVDITLNPGTYSVTEITEERYEAQEAQSVTIVSGQTSAVTFNNKLKRGSLEVIKTSEDQFVEGVTFRLYGTSLSGEVVEMFAVTDSTGRAVFSDVLVSGNEAYILEEVNTEVRYVVPEPQQVTIQWNQTAHSRFHNTLKKFRVKAAKADRENGNAQGDASLEGAVYGLYRGEELMASYRTDAEGIFTTDYFVCGSDWTLREITPSEGYLLDTTVYELPADPGEYHLELNPVNHKVFEDVVKGRIRLVKHIDAEMGDGGEGAQDTLGFLEAANTAVVSVGLELGTEQEMEAETENGEESLETAEGAVPENRQPVKIPEEEVEASGAHGVIEQPEEGAEFQIYLTAARGYEEARETERDVLVTDKDGFAMTKDLPYGCYTVHQTKGQEGQAYVKDFTVMIREDGEIYSYIINNQTERSLIRIEKHDAETGKMIPAATVGFQVRDKSTGELITQTVYYPTPVEITTYFTNEEGWLMLPCELPYGEYELIEVETCYGYVLDSEPVPFIVDGTQDVVVVEKRNMPQKGKITVTKIGEVWSSISVSGGEEDTDTVYTPVYESQVLAGAEYEIHASEDIVTPDGTLRAAKGDVVDTITTGADGRGISKELYLGTYDVVETKAPVPLALNPEVRQVRLAYAGQEVSLTEVGMSMFNERQKVKISLEKVMEQNEAFGIGGNGEAANVEFGLYASEDMKAEDGSMIPADGLIEIVPVSQDGHATVQTDLPLGSYYLKERATDSHYLLSEEKYPVVFEYAGQELPLVEMKANQGEDIVNELIYGSVSGKKTDDKGHALAGARIGLFAPETAEFTEETAIMAVMSDEKGTFRFDGVPYGSWFVREIAPPEGFVLSTALYELEIGEEEQNITLVIDNKAIYGNLHLSKIDKDNPERKLSGAVFEVYRDINGNEELDREDVLLGTMKEVSAGEYRMEDVRYGGVLVKEKIAPEGFQPDEKAYYVFIGTDGETYEVDNTDGKGFCNLAKQGSLKIVKSSSDGKKEGFSFRIIGEGYDQTFQTDSNGEILIEKLRIGRYTVTEIEDSVSVEYKRPAPVTVELVEGETLTVKFHNEKEAKETKVTTDVPKTGDNSNPWLWFGLTAIGAGGALAICVRGVKSRKQKRKEPLGIPEK